MHAKCPNAFLVSTCARADRRSSVVCHEARLVLRSTVMQLYALVQACGKVHGVSTCCVAGSGHFGHTLLYICCVSP